MGHRDIITFFAPSWLGMANFQFLPLCLSRECQLHPCCDFSQDFSAAVRLFRSVSSPLCEFLLLLELPLQLDDHANLLLVDRLPARLRLVARGVVGQRGGGEGGLDSLKRIIERHKQTATKKQAQTNRHKQREEEEREDWIACKELPQHFNCPEESSKHKHRTK